MMPSNHTPFLANDRHFWLKALVEDDWNDNQIKKAQLSHILMQMRMKDPSVDKCGEHNEFVNIF